MLNSLTQLKAFKVKTKWAFTCTSWLVSQLIEEIIWLIQPHVWQNMEVCWLASFYYLIMQFLLSFIELIESFVISLWISFETFLLGEILAFTCLNFYQPSSSPLLICFGPYIDIMLFSPSKCFAFFYTMSIFMIYDFYSNI